MDHYRVPSNITLKNVFLCPSSGALYMAALVGLVLRFGGWPTTAPDAAVFLTIFNIVAAFTAMFVIMENDDWQEDMARGTKPYERYGLLKLMAFHGSFSLGITILGAIVMFSVGYAALVLTAAVFLAGSVTMSVMLMGRK